MKIVDNETASNSDRYEVDKFDFNQRQIGILDLAFTVDDITSVLKYITDNGGDLISEPLESPAGFPALHSYARDPEGNVLHIAQNINL
jgi:predicted enzyme related to lactoylglutathione lyase